LSSVIEQQTEQVQWRRNKVQELRSKGYSQREILQILLIGLATVKRLSYLRNQAKTNIRKYIDEGRYRTRKVLRSRKENL
jgi:Trp operon repressor